MNETILLAHILIFVACVFYWVRLCEYRFSHPYFVYLAFHFISYVLRPLFCYFNGTSYFLSEYVGFNPEEGDHEWALFLSSAGLVAMLVGGYAGESRAVRRPPPDHCLAPDPGALKWVGTIILILGFASYAFFGRSPLFGEDNLEKSRIVIEHQNLNANISSSSAYITGFYSLIAGVMIVWISTNGIKKLYVGIITLYFFFMMYNGSNRTNYVVGAIAVLLSSMNREDVRWPKWRGIGVMVVVAVCFLSGKQFIHILLNREQAAVSEAASTRVSNLARGELDVLLNYDMMLTVTSVVPKVADHTYFSFYARPLYFWVPRAMWPGKPIFDFPAAYLQAKIHSIDFRGLTVTLVGESYLAFGAPGVIVLMALYGNALFYIHRRAIMYPANSVVRMMYVGLYAALFQAFRDGIVSLPLFLLYYSGPCFLMAGWTILTTPATPAAHPGGAAYVSQP